MRGKVGGGGLNQDPPKQFFQKFVSKNTIQSLKRAPFGFFLQQLRTPHQTFLEKQTIDDVKPVNRGPL